MAISPISGSSIRGIQNGIQGLRRNAAEIAGAHQISSKFPTKNLVRAMVELHQNSQQVSASVKAFKTSDQMIGTLLDIKA